MIEKAKYIVKNTDFEQFNNLITASQYLLLYKICSKYLSEGMTVLDWGLGGGHFSYFLQHENIETHGYTLDENPVFINYLSNVHVVIGTEPKSLPYADETFDIVFSIGVLEHVVETGGNVTDSLHEINRILKNGGHFICYHSPNKYSWVENYLRKFTHKYTNPVFIQSHSYLLNILKSTNFEIVVNKRYGILPRNIFKTLPIIISNSMLITKFYNNLDLLLNIFLNPIGQKQYFIAKKQ